VAKLCAGDDLTREEAGFRMGVSRGTIQPILAAARKKVVQALTEGAAVVVK
jgi:predicted DNA-binding protein (UPF0251 family)